MHPGSRWKRCQENNSTAKTCNSHQIESTVLFELDSGDGSHYQAAFFLIALVVTRVLHALKTGVTKWKRLKPRRPQKRGQKITPQHRCQIAWFASNNILQRTKTAT